MASSWGQVEQFDARVPHPARCRSRFPPTHFRGHAARGFRQTSGMRDVLGQRLLVLAAVALLGIVVALAIVERRGRDDARAGLTGAPAPAGWNTAFAGSRGPAGDAQRTTCGQVLADDSLGVTHPVLPCGAKLILRNGDEHVLSEVIDHALVEPGRQLEVTAALGQILDLDETAEIEWRFATDAS